MSAYSDIDSATLDILKTSAFDGCKLILPDGLARPVYVLVNKVIEALGGKWNRKAKGHLFPSDAQALIEAVTNGDAPKMPKKNPLAFYRTPQAVIDRMMAYADLDDLSEAEQWSYRVLEPSAGDGAIAREILRTAPHVDLTAIELDPVRCAALAQVLSGRTIANEMDFLQFIEAKDIDGKPLNYDLVLMNRRSPWKATLMPMSTIS